MSRLITCHLSTERYEEAIFYLFRFYSLACISKQTETSACISLKNFLGTAQFKDIMTSLNVNLLY